ncbi:MAG: phage holin family protein [Tissierellia bacterium]|nr:phage holin family protein [Tissierellia bacterium]
MIIERADLCNQVAMVASNPYVHIFVWAVIVDIFSGIVKAFFQKIGNSTKGLKGLLKHLLVVVVVILANIYLPLLGYDSIANYFIFFFIVQYGISIIENWGQMGLPLPQSIKNVLYKLNDVYDIEIEREIEKNQEDFLK